MPVVIDDFSVPDVGAGVDQDEDNGRPANMWAADLEGYTPTADDKAYWRDQALGPQLRDILPLGGGKIISPYDGMF